MDSMAFIYVPFPKIDQLQHVAFGEEKDPFIVVVGGGGGECVYLYIFLFEMTKTLSMVSYKIMTLMLMRVCNFLIFKFITCFIDSFTLKMKSQSIAYLLHGSEYI